MEKIRIKNLRTLDDTGCIDIKPLTVLVGKNSSGKSTFLRFFPLMKQTVLTKKNEPILWYSKDNVDFGSFEESINKQNKEKPIEFEFYFKMPSFEIFPPNILDMYLRVSLEKDKIKELSMKVYENEFLFAEQDGSYSLHINNKKITNPHNLYTDGTFNSFLPSFTSEKMDDDLKEPSLSRLKRRSISKDQFEIYLLEYLMENTSIIDRYADEKNRINILRSDINDIVKVLNMEKLELLSSKKRDLLKNLKKEIDSNKSFLRDLFEDDDDDKDKESFLSNLSKENIIIEHMENNFNNKEEYDNLSNVLLLFYINPLINLCNDYFDSYFSKVHYIAPLRASAQRYYRIQGLAVDEIDPQGENIPMAIHNLSFSEKNKFKNWTKRNFGFEIDTKPKSGHITLTISFNDSDDNLNLTDTGFGFSQILPIILLLWRTENIGKKRHPDNNFSTHHNIVIEQPELHLHPALQAKLTDALVNCIFRAKNKIKLSIIIETHSETIINRIGTLIYKKRIQGKDINILIFGNSENSSKNCLKSATYDEEGIINEWPLGFFYPED